MRATECQCDQCGATLEVPEDHPHFSIECRHCLVSVVIPEQPDARTPPPPPPAPAPVAEPGAVDQVSVRVHPCHQHPRAPGTWRCERCGHYSCEDCAHQLDLIGVEAATCSCQGRLVRQRVVNARTHRAEFREGIWEGLCFPFRGSGRYLLLSILVVAFLGTLVSFAGLMGWAVCALVYFLLTLWSFTLAYDVVHQTIEQPERDLEGPDVHDAFQFLGPLFKILAVTALYLGPCLTAVAVDASPVVALAALAAGAYLWPMAFLATVVHDDLHGLHPVLVVRAALRVPRDHAVVAAVVLVTGAATWAASWLLGQVPLLAPALGLTSMVVFLVVQGRLLGMLYRVNRERLGWV